MQLAKVILEMPPVLEKRQERGETVEEDPKLKDYDSHRHVFVDISMSVSNRVRLLGVLGNCEYLGILHNTLYTAPDYRIVGLVTCTV